VRGGKMTGEEGGVSSLQVYPHSHMHVRCCVRTSQSSAITDG
jgi:hypothetical protein